MRSVAQMIQTAHAGIEDPSKPTAVFMFVGPSGVGKTETALALSDLLYGGEENVITINMSEYQEAHTVSGLKGSPPGYVGYGEGGRAHRSGAHAGPTAWCSSTRSRRPTPMSWSCSSRSSTRARWKTARAGEIDFKNTLIILTSNLGTDLIMKVCADEETRPDPSALAEMLRPDLLKHFKPAFLGRLKVVPYYPITDKIMQLIVRLKLNRIKKRMMENRKCVLESTAKTSWMPLPAGAPRWTAAPATRTTS